MIDDKTLSEKLQLGEDEAYRALFDAYYTMLCRYSYYIVKDTDIAEEIVCELLLHLFERRNMLKINPPIRNYLIRAVKNRSLNYLALKRSELEVSVGKDGYIYDMNLSTKSNPLDELLYSELFDAVSLSINKLPDVCRTVFIMSRYDNKSYVEIAKELNISVNTVKYHIKHAIARLKLDLNM